MSESAERPWQHIEIVDCGEPLQAIPANEFVLTEPHPYKALGAPYGPGVTPFALRVGALEALRAAQRELQAAQAGWRFKIFDAYRPISVQQYMVDYTFNDLVVRAGKVPGTLTPAERRFFVERVYQFWSPPSPDPADAPPHSTGGAVDVTLVNDRDRDVDFGSPVDEVSERSHPGHYAGSVVAAERDFHRHRQLLEHCMVAAGFAPHPREWWHFSRGDRLWAWQQRQQMPDFVPIAYYGRVDLLATAAIARSPR